jgi:hypothetical protein
LNNSNVESILCKIGKGEDKINFGLFYRPPNNSTDSDRLLYDQVVSFSKTKCVIAGDFNYPGLNWQTMQADNQSSEFRDKCLDSFLHQHVLEPTRKEAILDIVLSTEKDMVQNVEVIEPLGNSDHNSVDFDIISDNFPSSVGFFYNFRKANFQDMKVSLKKVNWTNKFKNTNIEEAWNELKKEIITVTDKYVPCKQSKLEMKPKWLNSNVRNKLKRKKQAWKQYKATKDNTSFLRYKKFEKEAKIAIKISKKDCEKELASTIKDDPKKFFSYANNKKASKPKIGPIKEGDNLLTEDKDIATALNKFFTSVFTDENLEYVPDVPKVCENDLTDFIITEDMVEVELNRLKVNKAPGGDSIHPAVLKECAKELLEPLTIVFNKSLSERKSPSDWKKANVTPLFKKGSKKEAGNYRPVSLTSVPGKIFESIIKKRLMKHMEENNLLRNSQHGFLSGRSCLTNLLEYLEYVTAQVDQGNPVDVIYLDFSKAFDKVPHARLIRKVESMGFGSQITSWIEDWLKDRSQRVVLNGTYSNWSDVTSGVPQGSVLGPILFLIYVNDMDCGLETNISKFADDTKIFNKISNTSDQEKVQKDLHKLTEWSSTWQMKFNADKCKVLHFGNNNKQHDYLIGDKVLEKSSEEKDLGIYIQNNLKPGRHIDESVKKANQILGRIYRTMEYKSVENILPLYLTLVRPHLEYCVQAWAPYFTKDIEKLENVQKRALRMIPELSHLSYEEKLEKLNLFSLTKRRLRGDMIETFKIFQGLDNLDSEVFFSRNFSKTRGHSYKLYKGPFKRQLRQNFYSQRIIEPWNRLPPEVVEAPSLGSFKNSIDIYFQENNIF